MGESNLPLKVEENKGVAVDTFGGRIHVEWDPAGAATPLGHLAFFIEFLKQVVYTSHGLRSIPCITVVPMRHK